MVSSETMVDDNPAESDARTAYFASAEVDPEPVPRSDVRSSMPWLPSVGSVRGFNDFSKTLSSRIINKFRFPQGSLVNFKQDFPAYDLSYEHDLKLLAEGRSLIQPACQNEENDFWARRGRGMDWNSDLPKPSKPYFDLAASDPCKWMDLTVGIKYPRNLDEDKTYTTRVFSRPGRVPSNPVLLTAQSIARKAGCPSAKVCGFTKQSKRLVGPSVGELPGCRSWRPGEDSTPCP